MNPGPDFLARQLAALTHALEGYGKTVAADGRSNEEVGPGPEAAERKVAL